MTAADTKPTLKSRLLGFSSKIGDLLTEALAPLDPLYDDCDGDFQQRAGAWLTACFGAIRPERRQVRTYRFLEEALELAQALALSRTTAMRLVDYVYARPKGDPHQEVGGVMVTLAGACLAHDLHMGEAAEDELARCWDNIDLIYAKNAAKPDFTAPAGITDRERAYALYTASASFTTAYFAELRGVGVPGRANTRLFALSELVASMREDFAAEITASDPAQAHLKVA